jgi:phosphatidylserine/phosphatidylglycerophosphate/cardiolipin synthase-like enzyme
MPPREAQVRVVTGALSAAFAAEASRSRPHCLWIVSPWLSDDAGGDAFEKLVALAKRRRLMLRLVTRPATNKRHEAAIEIVRRLPKNRVRLHESLHAKLYIAESRTGGVAVIGSANLTAGADRLAELGLIIRGKGRSRVIQDLARAAAALEAKGDRGLRSLTSP